MQAINYYHLCVRITIFSVTRPVFKSSFNLSMFLSCLKNYIYLMFKRRREKNIGLLFVCMSIKDTPVIS